MNRIQEGKIYTAIRQKAGSSSKGDWELLITEDERGYNPIALFAENRPSGVLEGGKFRIEKIISASFGSRQSSDGTWNPSVSISAVVSPVESIDEFLAEQSGEEGTLPFEDNSGSRKAS